MRLGPAAPTLPLTAKASTRIFPASYFIQWEFAPDHPDRLAEKPWVVDNQWPRDLPGFRHTMVEYFAAMVALTRRLLGLQSVALGLAPKDYLASHEAFRPPRHTLRLLHYPACDPGLPGQYGFSPHTDLGFFAILAQAALPGLEFLAAPQVWVEAPALEGHLLVMTGDMARFWTNDRFRAMPHRVINGNGRERYAVPFFVTPRGDVAVRCFPGCWARRTLRAIPSSPRTIGWPRNGDGACHRRNSEARWHANDLDASTMSGNRRMRRNLHKPASLVLRRC